MGHHLEAVEGGVALAQGAAGSALEDAVASVKDLTLAGRNTEFVFVVIGPCKALTEFSQQLTRGDHPELRNCTLRVLDIKAPLHSKHLATTVPRIVADAERLGLGFQSPRIPVLRVPPALPMYLLNIW